MDFQLKSKFAPTGDQPQAIDKLTNSISQKNPHQTLLGVTGSGKTFTVANVIQNTNLPTLVICHNKTLASQLYQEFRDFFPKNAVSYFVSYYDYYQPEAYLPQSDTYIEKETSINAEIDKLRLTTTANLMSRPDCIVIASVSAIYNLGSPVTQENLLLHLIPGQVIDRRTILANLLDLQYQRTTSELQRGTFRLTGNRLEIFPAQLDLVYALTLDNNTIISIELLDPLNFTPVKSPVGDNDQKIITIYPAKHYLTSNDDQKDIFKQIKQDLNTQVKLLEKEGKTLEAHRLQQKVTYDLSMIQEMGYVNGIENYSRYFDGRQPGDPPYTLLDFFAYNQKKFNKPNFLTVIDESHITLPQIRGMYFGDRSRKQTLIDFGFRLPSALDNRPLTDQEFESRTPIKLYASATPNNQELSLSRTSTIPTVAEQLIRPTGLLDPQVSVHPTKNQITHLVKEIMAKKQINQRTLCLTLTKRTAEDLAEYLNDPHKIKKIYPQYQSSDPLKVQYLHSDINTLDRADILDELRQGKFDCLIGINLLREGLDLPEVSLIAILDADKEGFLRTPTALIQTMGRAARHVDGQVILYADKVSASMKQAIDETSRRRQIQQKYNQDHHITPQSIAKPVRDKLLVRQDKIDQPQLKELFDHGWDKVEDINPETLTPKEKTKLIKKLTFLMNQAAKDWQFERATQLRDIIKKLS